MNLKLLICIVNKKKMLDQVLAALFDLDIGGATVIDSTGVGRSKVEDVLLFEGFKDVLRGAQKNHYTVLVVLKKTKEKKVVASLTDIYKNFKERSIGFFFTVPIDNVWGLHMANKR